MQFVTSFQAIESFLVWDSLASVVGKKIPDKCVVFGSNNRPNKRKGIYLHPIPFYGTEVKVKRQNRKKWVDFVKLKRANWEPTKYSGMCSKHYPDEDYSAIISEKAEEG